MSITNHSWKMLSLSAPLLTMLMVSACNSELSRKNLPAVDDPFVVEEVIPPAGALKVERSITIEIHFSNTIDRSSLGPGLVLLENIVILERIDGAMPEQVESTYTLDSGDKRLLLTPTVPLAVSEVEYRITIFPGLRDLNEQDLDIAGSPVPVPSEFTTELFEDITPPEFDGITMLEVISSSALRASWEPATDDLSPVTEIVYRVYRNDPPGQLMVDYSSPVGVTSAEVTDFLLTGLSPDTEYTVGVRAVDGLGNESHNLEILTARTLQLPPDTTPPAMDGITELIPLSETTLEARWAAATDDRDNAANIRYRVYLTTNPPPNFQSPFLTTALGVTQVSLDNLDPDTSYFVAVRAVDTSNNEDDNTITLEARTHVSFAQNVFPIFSTPALGGCIQRFCHSREGRAGGLSLETHEDLVIMGGNTVAPPTIAPGNASESFLIWKIDRISPNFTPPLMPLGAPALDPELIGIIRRWINQGAADN